MREDDCGLIQNLERSTHKLYRVQTTHYGVWYSTAIYDTDIVNNKLV